MFGYQWQGPSGSPSRPVKGIGTTVPHSDLTGWRESLPSPCLIPNTSRERQQRLTSNQHQEAQRRPKSSHEQCRGNKGSNGRRWTFWGSYGRLHADAWTSTVATALPAWGQTTMRMGVVLQMSNGQKNSTPPAYLLVKGKNHVAKMQRLPLPVAF